ncbi:MAG TPA: gamma-glutamyltransferase [Gemmatimonadaceae bacterium]|nr:gamma-glutamyltransferase [Gemmatimonadaceae bacterium]
MRLMLRYTLGSAIAVVLCLSLSPLSEAAGQRTQKPVLHGRHWVAVTGKPLAATAGSMIFQKGGNAIDAAAAMLAAVATMWDVLSWGGETQALLYNPKTQKVIGINALGVAPTGATPEFYKSKGLDYPPEYGPLAAVTPGTPGGLLVMLAEFGTLSLADVLAPAIQMADGYPIENDAAESINRQRDWIKKWKYASQIFFTHPGEAREAPVAGEIFKQADLAATLRKLVEAERDALKKGKSRKEAIYAAYDRFYKGDIAKELVRGAREEGALFTEADLANWKVQIEEPAITSYKGIDVYKLTAWTQGPMLLQSLNILENFDVKAMGYNSAKYMHALYQTLNLAFADRDFYYGDTYVPPEEPIKGLLSKDYAKTRAASINWEKNDPNAKPGDPYPFQGGTNPYLELLKNWPPKKAKPVTTTSSDMTAVNKVPRPRTWEEAFYAGTTSIQAADTSGWVISVTPSGGWIPSVIAGRTGVGMSQRAQSFVTDPNENPFNVIQPGKRPRVTLTPSLALKDGKPYMAFSVQGGDSQDQNLLQFFLNVVEFGMNVQESVEAANLNSFQLRNSFDDHSSRPGDILVRDDTPPWVRSELQKMGYKLQYSARTSGPITAIWFDWKHRSFWGAASNHGDDYGIAW